jgi:hypothetical protein
MPWENRVTDMSGEIRKDPIVPPLVIGERWDLAWFPSVRAAEGYFEPWYAHEDYVAFDSSGQRLILDSGATENGGSGAPFMWAAAANSPSTRQDNTIRKQCAVAPRMFRQESRIDDQALANGRSPL